MVLFRLSSSYRLTLTYIDMQYIVTVITHILYEIFWNYRDLVNIRKANYEYGTTFGLCQNHVHCITNYHYAQACKLQNNMHSELACI